MHTHTQQWLLHTAVYIWRDQGDQQVAKKCGKEEESYIFEMETAGIKLFIWSKFQCWLIL